MLDRTTTRQSLGSILAIAHSFPPETTPTANRTAKLLKHLKRNWTIQVLTGTHQGTLENIPVHFAQSIYPHGLFHWLYRLKLDKLLELLVWPDPESFWIFPAFFKGLKLIKQQRSDCIVVFMMPYSAGIVGILLKWFTGTPLVLNLDDSPTCIDMHPSFPTWFHYQMTRWLEDFYIQQADSIIYVSQLTLDIVRARQPLIQQDKLNLVRYGADLEDFALASEQTTIPSCQALNPTFEIIYIGGMNGWYNFYHNPDEQTGLKHLYQRWMQFGRYERAKIDFSTSSPVFIGQAIQQLISQNPHWKGKVQVKVYGNRYPEHIVQRVLHNQGITNVVSVYGPVPHRDAVAIAQKADLLFLTLPDRSNYLQGGRISAKTYEYLMSDLPILAAIPSGENWTYLAEKPGVWCVQPTDIEAMATTIAQLATLKFSGQAPRYDRTGLHRQLAYTHLSEQFSNILETLMRNNITSLSPQGACYDSTQQ